MPTYTYRRGDGTTFEFVQRITESPLTECPTTGQLVSRIITTGAGVVFKGSGFYQNDYVRNGKKSESDGDAASKTVATAETAADKPSKKEEKAAEPAKPAAKSE